MLRQPQPDIQQQLGTYTTQWHHSTTPTQKALSPLSHLSLPVRAASATQQSQQAPTEQTRCVSSSAHQLPRAQAACAHGERSSNIQASAQATRTQCDASHRQTGGSITSQSGTRSKHQQAKAQRARTHMKPDSHGAALTLAKMGVHKTLLHARQAGKKNRCSPQRLLLLWRMHVQVTPCRRAGAGKASGHRQSMARPWQATEKE